VTSCPPNADSGDLDAAGNLLYILSAQPGSTDAVLGGRLIDLLRLCSV
jgi:hypothetical protein